MSSPSLKNEPKILSCAEVADYFLVLVDREAGDLITQLKLQKLVYFAQGISLALLGQPLFKEDIKAWKYGPVVVALRKKFGAYERDPIPPPGEMDFEIYSPSQKELIYKIYSTYGEHSAEYLANETHTHSIWKEAVSMPDQMISKDKIAEFFRKMKVPSTFLSISAKDTKRIITAEDEWWMNYDSGVPSEKVTREMLS